MLPRKKRRGRKPLGFLLFDLPGDHEVESSLSTECDTIASILHNRSLSTRVKVIRAASKNRLRRPATSQYSKMKFVHVAGHGSADGIGVLGGTIRWPEVVAIVAKYLKPLEAGAQRVLCLSCCSSAAGVAAFKRDAADYFTGYYHFVEDEIPFCDAITTWSMFYLKKRLAKPHEGMLKAINAFHGREVLTFDA
jgi:hypothetical protein